MDYFFMSVGLVQELDRYCPYWVEVLSTPPRPTALLAHIGRSVLPRERDIPLAIR